jgi:hypothetical protein
MNIKKIIFAANILLITPIVFAGDENVTYLYQREVEIEEEAEPYWEILLLGGTAELDAENTLIHVTNIETDKITQDNDGDWKSWTVQLGLGYMVPLLN